jgi:hypothetical protein
VKDPLRLFTQIEDPHSFGGRYPRPSGKRTLLETVHAWKRDLRREIRLNLRGQFTESPSAHLASLFPKKDRAHLCRRQGSSYCRLYSRSVRK